MLTSHTCSTICLVLPTLRGEAVNASSLDRFIFLHSVTVFYLAFHMTCYAWCVECSSQTVSTCWGLFDFHLFLFLKPAVSSFYKTSKKDFASHKHLLPTVTTKKNACLTFSFSSERRFFFLLQFSLFKTTFYQLQCSEIMYLTVT